ncbi:MAG TPA: SGNH/GDSL hydrolase family protein [Bacteroidia bacterium]|nr:SGNH/GDSL hydrolase family protein [Bacteroidia bacterium]
MKNNIYKSVLIVASISLFIGCKPNLPVPSPSKGEIDPTRYVSIGNSITSGFADGALYYQGQLVSFPNLISQQLKAAGGGNFVQPLMDPSSVGVGSTGNAPLVLGYSNDCLGVNSLGPVPTATAGDVAAFSNNIYAAQGPFNNMGVPGAKAITVALPGYGNPANGAGNYNPFFTRMAKNVATSSMLSDAMLLNPTFFSLFIGNNDVLLYATSGGAKDFITPQATFSTSINAIVDTLVKHGAKGVIGNVPDITALPYFTTVPWNGLTLRQGQADTLNGVMPFLGISYVFQAGNNPFVIYDASVNTPSHARVIQQGEFILLDVPLDSIKCHKMGTLVPIPNQYVLTATEINAIETAISGYNKTIQAAANNNNLAFVDVNAFLNQTKTGFVFDGVTFNAAFVTGGAFSLDGIHLTPTGNALLANEFIKSINAKYNSTILQVDVTKYHGVIFP